MGAFSRRGSEPDEPVEAAARGSSEGAEVLFEQFLRGPDGTKTRRMRRYDFRQTDKFSADQQKFLQRVLTRYGEALTSSLARMLRTKLAVDLKEIRVAPFQAFQQAIGEGSTIVVFRLNQEHRGAISLDFAFGSTLLDLRMGGRGIPREQLAPYGDVERAVFRSTSRYLTEAYRVAAQDIHDVLPEVESLEFNPLALHLGGLNDAMVLAEFSAQAGMGRGRLIFCLPFQYLKAVVPRASFDEFLLSRTTQTHSGGASTPLFAKNLEAAKVPVTVELGQTEVLFQDLLGIEVEDVIRLDTEISEPLRIKVNNRIKFLGRPGISEKRVAVKIEKVLTEGDEILEE